MSKNNDLLKGIIIEANNIVIEKGIKEEDDVFLMINVIKDDALLEEPKTEDGKRAREAGLVFDPKDIESPFVRKFDYNELRDETSNVAVIKALEAISKYKNLIFLAVETPESKKALSEDYNAATLELLNILSKNNVGISQFEYFFGALKGIMGALEKSVMTQVEGHTTEILSRLLGAKNPGTDKFDKAHATYEVLVERLKEVREATGNKMEDYFTIDNEIENED